MSFRVLAGTEGVRIADMVLQPFVRYVLPAGPAQAYAKAMTASAAKFSMSVFNAYARPYGGSDLNGKRLALYRHAAFGDQLMVTSVPVYLRHLYPQAAIDVYCSASVLPLWRGLPVRAFAAPLTFEAARTYDFHLFYDQMLEEDREPDQANAYDSLFAFAGHGDAPDCFKRPKVVETATDAQELLDRLPMAPAVLADGKTLVYQLGAANPNRTYPPEFGAEFVEAFLCEFPAWRVVVVGLDKEGKDWSRFFDSVPALKSNGRCLDLVNRLRQFRSLIPLVRQAGLVVCPDSSIGHLAAAFPKVPVISLWGLFAPADRAKYYPNHRALWPREVCPHAPCHNHDFALPLKLCRDATNAMPKPESCAVLRAISPRKLLETAREILDAKPASQTKTEERKT